MVSGARPRVRESRVHLSARDAQILRMRAAGATLRAISEAVGITRKSVDRALLRLGAAKAPRPMYKPEADFEVARRLAAGQSYAEIALRMGVDTRTVRKRAQRADAPERLQAPRRHRQPTSADDLVAWLADRGEGLSYREIGRRRGVSKATVALALKRAAGGWTPKDSAQDK